MRGTPVTERPGSDAGSFDPAVGHEPDIDDVDADMDVGAADQDAAVAAYLEDRPYGLRIDEIEDHDALGIGSELREEEPERASEPEGAYAPAQAREELARLLREPEDGERDGGD